MWKLSAPQKHSLISGTDAFLSRSADQNCCLGVVSAVTQQVGLLSTESPVPEENETGEIFSSEFTNGSS